MSFIEITPNIRGHLDRIRQALAPLEALRAAKERVPLGYSQLLADIERQDATAGRRYTVAFVGMYNCGKSTILNSLLGLKGESRLSDQDSPDTARCIRLTHRESLEEPECVLHFAGGTSESCTWAEAKAYTSRVYLEEHPEMRARAQKLEEVEYRIASPLLTSFDFLDLPGTGTSNWRTDTTLTHRRLKEAELIFWVIGTCAPEPADSDLEDLVVLREVKAQVVPLVNVWSDEEEEISGVVSPEEMEQAIRAHLGSFFAAGSEILLYYAREIDLARQQGRPLRPEWGFERLVTFLSGRLGADDLRRERIRRIGGAVRYHLKRLNELVESDEQLLDELQAELRSADDKLLEQLDDRLQIGRNLAPQIRALADGRSREVVAMFHDAASALIEEELRLSNWKILTDLVQRTPPEVVKERMRDRFRNAYLHLDASPSWLDLLYKDFLDEVRIVVQSAWARFLRNLQTSARGPESAVSVGADFLDQALGQVAGGLLQRGVLGVLIGVFTYLLFVPGGFILDVVSLLGLVLLQIFRDPLEKARETAKLRAKVALEANRIEIRNLFGQAGMNLHRELEQRFEEELKRRGQSLSADRQALQEARKAVANLRAEWASFDADMTAFAEGGLG